MMSTCKTLIHNYIIIGGGLAGLYTYERLQEDNKSLNILLLEKNDYLGGRMKEQNFHGTTIKLGAGIIDDTCLNMINILDKYKIKTYKSNSTHIDDHLSPKFDVNEAINQIKNTYYKETASKKRLELTVNQFLNKHFPPEFTKLFYLYADFTDFHDQDINDFILKYPIEDLSRTPSFVYSFKFKDLIDKLSNGKNIILNYQVKSIKKILYGNTEIFNINDNYYAHNIITATTIDCLKKLLNFSFLDQIQSIPFYRNYVYSDDLTNFKNGIIMANNEIKKMIKMNDNIIMIVYCDNDHANFWKKAHDISEQKQMPNIIKQILNKLLRENGIKLNILDSVHQYWSEGIHYYRPNNEDRQEWIIRHMNPEKGIYVVGEMMGLKQGWMEGALESVVMLFENHLHKKIKN